MIPLRSSWGSTGVLEDASSQCLSTIQLSLCQTLKNHYDPKEWKPSRSTDGLILIWRIILKLVSVIVFGVTHPYDGLLNVFRVDALGNLLMINEKQFIIKLKLNRVNSGSTYFLLYMHFCRFNTPNDFGHSFFFFFFCPYRYRTDWLFKWSIFWISRSASQYSRLSSQYFFRSLSSLIREKDAWKVTDFSFNVCLFYPRFCYSLEHSTDWWMTWQEIHHVYD